MKYLKCLCLIVFIGAYCVNTAVIADENYALPVPGCKTLSAGFNTPRPYGLHMALDIPCEKYSMVVAAVAGEVLKVDYDPTVGNYIRIRDNRGHVQLYAHLQRVYRVWPGDKIARGQMIGQAGETGKARGVHLHFAEFNEKGIPVQTSFNFGIRWKLMGDIYAYQGGQ